MFNQIIRDTSEYLKLLNYVDLFYNSRIYEKNRFDIKLPKMSDMP